MTNDVIHSIGLHCRDIQSIKLGFTKKKIVVGNGLNKQFRFYSLNKCLKLTTFRLEWIHPFSMWNSTISQLTDLSFRGGGDYVGTNVRDPLCEHCTKRLTSLDVSFTWLSKNNPEEHILKFQTYLPKLEFLALDDK